MYPLPYRRQRGSTAPRRQKLPSSDRTPMTSPLHPQRSQKARKKKRQTRRLSPAAAFPCARALRQRLRAPRALPPHPPGRLRHLARGARRPLSRPRRGWHRRPARDPRESHRPCLPGRHLRVRPRQAVFSRRTAAEHLRRRRRRHRPALRGCGPRAAQLRRLHGQRPVQRGHRRLRGAQAPLDRPAQDANTRRHQSTERLRHALPGPAEAWLYDIVRGKVVCESIVEILDVMRAIKQTIERAAEIAGCGRLLRVKNRCIHPPLSGCRDIMINIQLPVPRPDATGTFFTHVCEIQIHHRRMKEHDDAENSHKVYEFFRDFFAGGEHDTVEGRMAALEAFGERLDAIGRSAGGAAGDDGGGGGAAGGGAAALDLGMLVAWVSLNETDVGVLQALEGDSPGRAERAGRRDARERAARGLSLAARTVRHRRPPCSGWQGGERTGKSRTRACPAGGVAAHQKGVARRRAIQKWPSPSVPWAR